MFITSACPVALTPGSHQRLDGAVLGDSLCHAPPLQNDAREERRRWWRAVPGGHDLPARTLTTMNDKHDVTNKEEGTGR